MIKKLFATFSVILIIFTVSACSQEETTEPDPYESSPETQTFDFENLAEEYDVSSGQLDLYFYEEGVPYVSIDTFVGLLDGAIISDEIETSFEDGIYTMQYTLEAGESEEHIYEDTHLELELDLDNETVTVNRFAFFDGMSEETKTDFGEFLEVTDYEETIKDPVTIDLEEYDISAMEKDGDVLLPFQVANLFFSGGMYNAYFNGEMVYGIDSYQITDDMAISETLNDTSLNSEDIPEPVKDISADYLALSFDYFYGLKEVNGIDDYENSLQDYEDSLEGDDRSHYKAISDFLYAQDDIHTSPLLNGIYEDELSFQYSIMDLEERTRTYYEAYYNDALNAHCSDGNSLTLNDDGTKAIVKIDGFSKDSLDTFAGYMDDIDSEGTVDDVVIDLSCNGGGVLGTMIEMVGYMTDEPVDFYMKNSTDESTSVTTFDVDIEARDYDFHVLSSPLSYSAANSFLSIVKENNLATIMGQGSSGGASSVMTDITPSGSLFRMSSTDIMANSNYESIEYGIEVDSELSLEDITNTDSVFDALP